MIARAIAVVVGLGVSFSLRAADAPFYTVLQGGERVGFLALDRHVAASGTSEIETLRVKVRQGLGHRIVTRRVEVRRDARGANTHLDFRVEGMGAPIHWNASILQGRMQLSAGDGVARAGEVTIDGEPFLVARRAQAVRALRQPSSAALAHPRFDAAQLASQTWSATAQPRDAGAVEIHDRFGDRDDVITLDAAGDLAALTTQLFGVQVQLLPCARDCDAAPATAIDPIQALTVRSPVRIPLELRRRTLRYVLTLPTPFEVPSSSEQSVVRDGEHVVITLCDDCGSEAAPTAETLRHYLEPNAWVRSDAPEITGVAMASAWASQRVDLRMRALVKRTQRSMHGAIDFLGYSDAVEALKTGSGDCTEYAVLLAALARAQHIPTRVVAGLVYASRFTGKKDVFGPHMWVQAWDGARWKSYDAALEGFDSTHIALAIGDGSPKAFEAATKMMSAIRIEKAGVVRAPQ